MSTPRKKPTQVAPVRVRRAVDSAKALQDILAHVEATSSTVNELVTGFNGMAEDMAVVLSRTQALEATVETLAKAGLKWGGIAEENNRLSRRVEDMSSTSAKALEALAKIAESNARVLEEIRKRVG